jgi:hypothetical protein
MSKPEIEPDFAIEVPGYRFLGRGPEATRSASGGWGRREALFFRCVVCGTMMPSLMNDYFHCDCGAMSLDMGYGRFGSNHGDRNILVYERS